jgi:threonine dehydrogenase-like Zn-dependent dehydrogenase
MMPDLRVGHTFGHEFVGTVHAVGSSVENRQVGDRPIFHFGLRSSDTLGEAPDRCVGAARSAAQ